MNRIHRRWHFRIWLIIAPLLFAGVVVAHRVRRERHDVAALADVPPCCRVKLVKVAAP